MAGDFITADSLTGLIGDTKINDPTKGAATQQWQLDALVDYNRLRAGLIKVREHRRGAVDPDGKAFVGVGQVAADYDPFNANADGLGTSRAALMNVAGVPRWRRYADSAGARMLHDQGVGVFQLPTLASAPAVAPAGEARFYRDSVLGKWQQSIDGGAWGDMDAGGGVTYGAPVTIGTANGAGTGTDVARANHVHDHGAQTTSTHHAVVVAGGANGFMSGADKTKLDALPSTAPPTTLTLTAGAGLTGGGDLSANRSFAVGAGFGITVNADDVAVNQAMTPTWSALHIFNGMIRLGGSGELDGGSNEALANTVILGYYGGGAASTFRLKSRNGTGGALDAAGSHLALSGGRATGNALGGDVIFETSSGGEVSGTTTRDLVARWRVKGNTGHLLPESSGYDIATQATPVSSLWASDLRTTQIAPLSAASQLNLRGELAGGSAGADIIHDTLNTRTAGVLHSVRNNTVEKFAVAFDGSITTAGRVHEGKGSDIASAADITCTRGYHVITGTTTVKRIAKAGWSDGDVLRLRMSGTCTIGDAAATGDATWAKIVMYSNAQACQSVSLIYDGGVFYQLTYHVPTLP